MEVLSFVYSAKHKRIVWDWQFQSLFTFISIPPPHTMKVNGDWSCHSTHSFVFLRRMKVIRVWNDTRVSMLNDDRNFIFCNLLYSFCPWHCISKITCYCKCYRFQSSCSVRMDMLTSQSNTCNASLSAPNVCLCFCLFCLPGDLALLRLRMRPV